MLKITDKYQCSGCGACADVCPVHCIEYKEDAAGFRYPSIEVEKCIGCGACDRVCPIKIENISLREPEQCYAAWAKDNEIHNTSSSGGMGYLLGKAILERGGVVYGCSGESPLHVRHIRVDNVSHLKQLQGSKYVQSDTRGIYKSLKNDVKSGKDVLFIGTPCQVSAVNKLYSKKPDNIYTVDLICHGVPSQQMLNDQLNEISKKYDGQIPAKISFRDGSEYRFEITYPNNRIYCNTVWHEPYYRAFMSGLSLRPSCHKCPYAKQKRTGDLTIGDFWGIKNAGELPVQTGVSMVFASSSKGSALLKSIDSDLEMMQKPIEEAVNGNDQLRHPVKNSFHAKLFGKLYPLVSIRMATSICVADRRFVTLCKIIMHKAKIK